MAKLAAVYESLAEYSAGLRLGEEDLPSVFDAALLDTSLLLEETVGEEFSTPLAKRATALRLATKVLVEDPSPDSMALVLGELGALLAGLEKELGERPSAAEWRLARLYNGLTETLDAPGPQENQGFTELPRMLADTYWVKRRLMELALAAGLEWSRTPASKGLSRSAGRRWFRRASGRETGRLATAIRTMRGEVEGRSRQVWLLRRLGDDEMGPAPVYLCAHFELYPGIHSHLDERLLALETAKLQGLSVGLEMAEMAMCFESVDWITHYALNHLMPPAPADYRVRSARALRRLLDGRLSRWYACQFDNQVDPLEVAAAVLRMGRPLYYERLAAHALLEYDLLQGVAFTRSAAPSWMDVQTGLEREFSTMLDGHLLRLCHYSRLKRPEGWCAYLSDLNTLHFGGEYSSRFLDYRHAFFARRGLMSAIEILYRTTEARGMLQ